MLGARVRLKYILQQNDNFDFFRDLYISNRLPSMKKGKAAIIRNRLAPANDVYTYKTDKYRCAARHSLLMDPINIGRAPANVPPFPPTIHRDYNRRHFVSALH